MFKPIDYNTKKYHILKMLHGMSVERYRFVMTHIPVKLSISEALWNRWIYLSIEEAYEIRYSKLLELSQLLGVPVEDLINYKSKHHNNIIEESKQQLTIYDVGA